jgi:hypothetical protein
VPSLYLNATAVTDEKAGTVDSSSVAKVSAATHVFAVNVLMDHSPTICRKHGRGTFSYHSWPGKVGIPASSEHVSEQACVLRLVKLCNKGDGYALELVVLSSEPCTVT